MKQIFTINKPNIMKKSKYQQYFHCFIVHILPHALWLRGHSNIESSHSLRQNDAQTHPLSTLNVKMSNLPKIDVYNFKY